MRSRNFGTRGRATTAVALGAVAMLGLAACSNTASDKPSSEGLTSVKVIAPADPGGGWDQTARSFATVLTEDKIVKTAPVTNIGGAGGTVGLASLATEKDPATLMITGSVMVGAVETNKSDKRIEDMTPLAKITEEALVVVVPKDSPYKDIKSLLDAIVKDGPAISVTGGSAGGVDNILAALLVKDAGVPADKITSTLNYVPNAGGGEAVTMLLGNTAKAGISGVGEFVEQIKSGDLIALAVSGAERVEALPDVKTLKEQGIDVTLTNWRGLIAPAGISDADKTALLALIDKVHSSDLWKKTLKDKGWTDAYVTGPEFDTFLKGDIAQTQETLKTIGLVG